MKRLMCLGVGVSVIAFVAAAAAAQAPAQDAQKAKAVSVTGCLAAGADAKSFTLNDAMPAAAAEKEQSKEAPKSSEMKSYRVTAGESSLNLANHVGHKVTLTGTVEEKGAGAEAPGATGTAGGGKPTASLTATSLKMVSPTCTQ
jgi:hypothetical protein